MSSQERPWPRPTPGGAQDSGRKPVPLLLLNPPPHIRYLCDNCLNVLMFLRMFIFSMDNFESFLNQPFPVMSRYDLLP